MSQDECMVEWCDRGGVRHHEHGVHQGVTSQVLAHEPWTSERMTVQTVAVGKQTDAPRGVGVALVDRNLHRYSAEMTWSQAAQIGAALLDAAIKWGGVEAPPPEEDGEPRRRLGRSDARQRFEEAKQDALANPDHLL